VPTVKFDPNAERIHDVDRRQRRQEAALAALTERVQKLERAIVVPPALTTESGNAKVTETT
jgi:hypothetical protein